LYPAREYIDRLVATTTPTGPLRESAAWRALEAHAAEIRSIHLRDLFAEDATRGERLNLDAEGIYLDYSKNRITDETLRLLQQLAAERRVAERRDAMFAGEHVNVTFDKKSVNTVADARFAVPMRSVSVFSKPFG